MYDIDQMTPLFYYPQLHQIALEKASQYHAADPFPHICLDNIANATVLADLVRLFPSPQQLDWYKYDNPLEKKLATNHIELLPDAFRNVLMEFNSAEFSRFLEVLTGINALIPDPNFNGGGLHQIENGGKLDIHADYNYHPQTLLDRRVNVLLYLNPNWKDEYGGHLELWNESMSQPVQRILPQLNRMVIFNTTPFSYHGHPEPLTCPPGWTRKSLALYYYSNGRPEYERRTPHSTLYQKRPQDDDDPYLDDLRNQRAQRRISDLTTKSYKLPR